MLNDYAPLFSFGASRCELTSLSEQNCHFWRREFFLAEVDTAAGKLFDSTAL